MTLSLIGTRRIARARARREVAAEVFDEHPQNRSIEPNGARWIMTGACAALSAPMYVRFKADGQVVVHLHGAELPFTGR